MSWVEIRTLCAAAADGRDLRSLLVTLRDAGLHVDTPDEGGRTALHHACAGRHERSVRQLLSAGADANRLDSKGRTPMTALIEAAAKAAAADQREEGESVRVVDELLRCGAVPTLADVAHGQMSDGPFTYAACWLRAKIDVGYFIYLCCETGDAKALAKLFRSSTEARELVDWRHGAQFDDGVDEGCTPLVMACARGHHECVELLLAHGADTGVTDPKTGRTLLQIAREGEWGDLPHGHPQCVDALLRHQAKLDLEEPR